MRPPRARAALHTRCFESNRGANKKDDRRPEPRLIYRTPCHRYLFYWLPFALTFIATRFPDKTTPYLLLAVRRLIVRAGVRTPGPLKCRPPIESHKAISTLTLRFFIIIAPFGVTICFITVILNYTKYVQCYIESIFITHVIYNYYW